MIPYWVTVYLAVLVPLGMLGGFFAGYVRGRDDTRAALEEQKP